MPSFKEKVPHPDPLPSNGRGNSQSCLSQLPKDPHLLHFLTTENSKWHGPAASHLTLYVEPVNGKLRLGATDIQNEKAPHGLTQGPLRGGFNEMMTPYFGPGLLPHAQKHWIDELAVSTKRIGPLPAGKASVRVKTLSQ